MGVRADSACHLRGQQRLSAAECARVGMVDDGNLAVRAVGVVGGQASDAAHLRRCNSTAAAAYFLIREAELRWSGQSCSGRFAESDRLHACTIATPRVSIWRARANER